MRSEVFISRSPMHFLGAVCVLLLLVFVSPRLVAQSVEPTQAVSGPSATTETTDVPELTNRNAEYVIGPDDVLRVDVWKEPQVSIAKVVVQPDGRVSLPLVGVVKVGGLTPRECQDRLQSKYERFMLKPQVTLTVVQIKSKVVYVLGEVHKPGAYPLTGPIDVVQQIAKAGGLTSYARHKKIFVLRSTDGKTQRFPVNFKKLLNGNGPEQNIILHAGDTIVVP